MWSLDCVWTKETDLHWGGVGRHQGRPPRGEEDSKDGWLGLGQGKREWESAPDGGMSMCRECVGRNLGVAGTGRRLGWAMGRSKVEQSGRRP